MKNPSFRLNKSIKIKRNPFYLVFRAMWVFRYRFYTILSLLVLISLLYSSNNNVPNNIQAFGYKVEKQNYLYQDIVKIRNEAPDIIIPQINTIKIDKDEMVDFDYTSEDLGAKLKEVGIDAGYINVPLLRALKQTIPVPDRIVKLQKDRFNSEQLRYGPTLESIYPAPVSPLVRDFIRLPDYNINAPIVFATFEDMFGKKPDGSIDLTNFNDTSETDSPLQKRLQDGVVHLPFTPFPGDLGNCYIVGHSSNYAYIKSDYNTIFKPIESKGEVNQIFKINDRLGRELNFRIFSTEAIEYTDTTKAYTPYPDKRVCTLQTSIVTFRKEKGFWPYQRWLVRGELIQ